MKNLRELLCKAYLAARYENQDETKDYSDFDKWFDQNESKFENIICLERVPEEKVRSVSVLKLDKNFHVYLHGDKEKMETGTDENGKFLKLRYDLCHS